MKIVEEPISRLAEHAAIPIAFDAAEEWVARPRTDGAVDWEVRPVDPPRRKDYDAIPGAEPARWTERFDVTEWRILAAYRGDRRIGGAVLAWRSPGCVLLEGRDDLALIWDLRVARDARRTGVGRALVRSARAWSADRGCTALRIETQTINAAACALYRACGARTIAVVEGAYDGLPDEIQVLWELDCEKPGPLRGGP